MLKTDSPNPQRDLQTDDYLLFPETDLTLNNIASEKKIGTCNVSSSINTQSLDNLNYQVKEKSELGAMLDRFDDNLDRVLVQLESVKETRNEMFVLTRKLQHRLEQIGEESEADKDRTKKFETVTLEMKKREDIIKELGKREMLLSHLMLAIINSCADELESNFESLKRGMNRQKSKKHSM